jgi:hypothetical protein
VAVAQKSGDPLRVVLAAIAVIVLLVGLYLVR